MPIHDWTPVNARILHHFHQDWIVELARTLNRGCLPEGYFALAEQSAAGPIPDVLTLQHYPIPVVEDEGNAVGMAVTEAPPKV